MEVVAYNWNLKKDVELFKRWDKDVVRKIAKDFGTTCDVIRERIRLYRFRDYEEYPAYMFICIAFYLYGYTEQNIYCLSHYFNLTISQVKGYYNLNKNSKNMQNSIKSIKKINH